MSGKKNVQIMLCLAAAASVLASSLAVILTFAACSRMQFAQINAVCREIIRQEPEAEELVFSALKEYSSGRTRQNNNQQNSNPSEDAAKEDVLSARGYHRSAFAALSYQRCMFAAIAGAAAGLLLFLLTFFYRNQQEAARIRALTAYLEQVNTGKAALLSSFGEDDFSKLEDEIYKTVTFLCQTKDAALQARNDFAQNLSNIAHQIKTPITAISLSVQMIKQGMGKKHLEQVEKQVMRLSRLEEALLLLSRIDAHTLLLQKEEVDVFTLLVLAADNLQELSEDFGTPIMIPELGQMAITADLDWTMEALMNLMKNCMEHGSGGRVHCTYAQNPLYTEILIWDEGEGFAKEDIPHLFERFYRGKNAGEKSTGIGLTLAKEIIERQNGTIRARNQPEGGACFEIHFYRHLAEKERVSTLEFGGN